jgi:hypothetical protein
VKLSSPALTLALSLAWGNKSDPLNFGGTRTLPFAPLSSFAGGREGVRGNILHVAQDYDKSIKAGGGAHSSNAKQLFAARRAPVMEEQWPQLQLVRINYLIAWGFHSHWATRLIRFQNGDRWILFLPRGALS